MRLTMRRVAGLAAAAAMLGLIAPAAAMASQDTITFPDAGGNTAVISTTGQLSVTVDSTTALTSLSVSLSDGTNQLTLPFDDFTLTGSATAGTYSLTEPLTETQLPLGIYTEDATAADAGGGSVTDFELGTFELATQPTMTLAASATSLSYSQPQTTFSGLVTGVAPGGASEPLAGQTVTVSDQQSTYVAVTQSDGTYSVTATDPTAGYYQGYISQNATTAQATAPQDVQITTTSTDVQVTGAFSKVSVVYGQPDTVSGLVTFDPDGTWIPLADATVAISNYYPSEQTTTVTTNSAGAYTATLPGSQLTTMGAFEPTSWQVRASGTGYVGSDFLTINGPSLILPTAVSRFAASLSSLGTITIKGCLGITAPGGQNSFPIAPLTVQYAARARGPWRTLGKITGSQAGGGLDYCTGDSRWIRTFAAPRTNAYYKVRFTGSSQLLASTSGVLHRWKNLTKITSFAVSPRSAASGGDISVSGRLLQHGKSWRSYGRRKVSICVIYEKALYCYKHRLTTSSSGRFSGEVRAPSFSAPWLAVYFGDSTHFAYFSAEIRVTVDGRADIAGWTAQAGTGWRDATDEGLPVRSTALAG
jgi:hypothetical protein